MKLVSRFRAFLAFIFHRIQVEREMEDELRSHLESRADDPESRGLPRAEAGRQTRIEFEGCERYKEDRRDVGAAHVLETLAQDVRYGLRQLRRSSGFTAVAVLTLALGIGVNTAIFSLIDAVMLRMLPVARPGELFQVQVGNADESGGGSEGESPLTTAIWEQLRDQRDVFSSTFAWAGTSFYQAEVGTTRAVDGIWVSGSFFSVLGLRPAAGRLVADSDDRRGCPAVAVLSYGFWQDHYGGAKSAIGSTLSLASHPFEVIGVAPPDFFGMEVGGKFDVAAPICAKAIIEGKELPLDNVQVYWLNVGGARQSESKQGATHRATPNPFDQALRATERVTRGT